MTNAPRTTDFGTFLSDVSYDDGLLTSREVVIQPRDYTGSRMIPGTVRVTFTRPTGEWMIDMRDIPTLSMSECHAFWNAMSGIKGWADRESWEARYEYQMQQTRERLEREAAEA